jgi:hypothetical protein
MVKIKLTKNVENFGSIGDVLNITDENDAKMWVTEGAAVYERLQQLEDSKKEEEQKEESKNLTEEDKLIRILKRKNLFNDITEIELDRKIVGEVEARKVIFLCACGRLVENCQIASYNLLVNDEAGTGKDYVTHATLSIMPKEQYVKKTRISPAVFTYWHNSTYDLEWTWNGKVFYTEDISESVLNHEVFKVMCSSGSEATVVIKQRAIDIHIEGKPVMITTTATSIPNPELTRRFEILNLSESKDQTKAIIERHAKFAVLGISPEYDEKYTKAMVLLKRVKVRIPYASKLCSLFPTESIMMRTKFPRFLDLIKASAAFHQFQRKCDKSGFLLANWQDYEISCQIMRTLISNRYFIPLTKIQRKIMAFFEEIEQKEPNFNENATRIRQKLLNFISLPALQTNLAILTKYGILSSCIEEDSHGRDIEKYSLNKSNINLSEKVYFPSFSVLCGKDIKPIIVKKERKDSKVNLHIPMETEVN